MGRLSELVWFFNEEKSLTDSEIRHRYRYLTITAGLKKQRREYLRRRRSDAVEGQGSLSSGFCTSQKKSGDVQAYLDYVKTIKKMSRKGESHPALPEDLAMSEIEFTEAFEKFGPVVKDIERKKRFG